MYHTVIAIGDSITEGAHASSPERSWVRILAELVWLHQGQEGELCNLGVGGSVLHHGAPTYAISYKPCGLDAYESYRPRGTTELMVIAHGFNDCRGGEPVEVFETALRGLLRRSAAVPERTVVVCSPYFSDNYAGFPPYDRATRDRFLAYREAVQRSARECGCIFADVWGAIAERPWLLSPIDRVHPNDLGHRLIANRIFEALAHEVDVSTTSQLAPSGP